MSVPQDLKKNTAVQKQICTTGETNENPISLEKQNPASPSFLSHPLCCKRKIHNYVAACPYSCGKLYSFTFSLYRRVLLVSYYRQNGSLASLPILKLSIIFIISPHFKLLLFSCLQLGTTLVLWVEISPCFVSASSQDF